MFDLRLAKLAYHDERMKLLMTIPGGSKTIRSLDDTHANEGLPARTSLPPGEVRHLQETRTVEFVEKISKPQLIPGKSKSNAQTAKNTGRQLENTQSEK